MISVTYMRSYFSSKFTSIQKTGVQKSDDLSIHFR